MQIDQPPITWWLISFSAAENSHSNPEYPAQYKCVLKQVSKGDHEAHLLSYMPCGKIQRGSTTPADVWKIL